MLFINTRPSCRAKLLTDAMQSRGLQVLELPLLELQENTISDIEQQYQQSFTQTHDYQALVVVSPSAARLGLAKCPQNFQPSCPVIAVGQATALILQQAGWHVICPDEANNESMIQMHELASLDKGDRVLVWRGRGGRRLLVNYLQDKGVSVDAIAWYRRQCPKTLAKDFISIQPQLQKQLQNSPQDADKSSHKLKLPIVLISSGEAFTHWRRLLIDISAIECNNQLQGYALASFCYVTFGKRLTDMLTDLQLECRRIDSLFDEEVWRGIRSFYE